MAAILRPVGRVRTITTMSKPRPLAKSDWRRKLHNGDEVTWNDPDRGLCTRTGKISSIRYLEDDTAVITWQDGGETGVFLRELS